MLQGGTDPIQGLVVVVRIVVEGHQLLGAGRLAQADTLLPGRVPPAVEALELLVGVGGVVDYEVSTAIRSRTARSGSPGTCSVSVT